MNRDLVIHRLREHVSDIQAMGATSLNLYGSVARDAASADSDVDLFIDYVPDGSFTVIELIRLRTYLSELLGSPVDLTTRGGLHPLLRDEVARTALRVF